jgi:hypothetical protein
LIRRSEALRQPFDIFELELRAEVLASGGAILQDAACARRSGTLTVTSSP